MTSNTLIVEPPHDDVVENRGVVGVEQVGVLGSAGRDPAEIVGEGPLAAWPAPIGPSTRTVPRWLTSKTTAPLRHARCSSRVPEG